MQVLKTTALVQACTFDMVKDGNNGAIGNYLLPIQLPGGAIISNITYVSTIGWNNTGAEIGIRDSTFMGNNWYVPGGTIYTGVLGCIASMSNGNVFASGENLIWPQDGLVYFSIGGVGGNVGAANIIVECYYPQ
jgi:hypothetical protein